MSVVAFLLRGRRGADMASRQTVGAMNNAEATFDGTASDEIVRLLLSVARRADELMRGSGNVRDERDFWREAEVEVLAESGVRAR